jgi:hypothetical protein
MLDRMRGRGIRKARREGRDDPTPSAVVLSLLSRLEQYDQAVQRKNERRDCAGDCDDLCRVHGEFVGFWSPPANPPAE